MSKNNNNPWFCLCQTCDAVNVGFFFPSCLKALVQLFTIAEVTGRLDQGTPEQLLLRRFATPVGSTMIILGVSILFLGELRFVFVKL